MKHIRESIVKQNWCYANHIRLAPIGNNFKINSERRNPINPRR